MGTVAPVLVTGDVLFAEVFGRMWAAAAKKGRRKGPLRILLGGFFQKVKKDDGFRGKTDVVEDTVKGLLKKSAFLVIRIKLCFSGGKMPVFKYFESSGKGFVPENLFFSSMVFFYSFPTG